MPGGDIRIASAGLIREAARAGTHAANAAAAVPDIAPMMRLVGCSEVTRTGRPSAWVYWLVNQLPNTKPPISPSVAPATPTATP